MSAVRDKRVSASDAALAKQKWLDSEGQGYAKTLKPRQIQMTYTIASIPVLAILLGIGWMILKGTSPFGRS